MSTDWLEFAVILAGILGGAIVGAKPAIALAQRGVKATYVAGAGVLIAMIIGTGAGVAFQWLDWWTWDTYVQRQLVTARIVEQQDFEGGIIYELVQPASSTAVKPNVRLVRRRLTIEWYGAATVGAMSAIVAGPCSLALTHRYRKRRKLGLCMKCGYDLRASSDRCPECGTEFERST
jgi:MFS family permease